MGTYANYVMRKKKAGKIISHACVHEAETF